MRHREEGRQRPVNAQASGPVRSTFRYRRLKNKLRLGVSKLELSDLRSMLAGA